MKDFQRHAKVLELDKILLKLAGECSCADAAEAAKGIVPAESLHAAEVLLNQTVDAHMLMARFGSPSFGGLVNINNALLRAESGGMLSMGELLNVASVLRVIRILCDWHSQNAGVKTILTGMFESLSPNKYLEEKITTSIISDEEMSDNASPALYDIRRKMRSASSKVKEQLEKMIRSANTQKYLQESIITQRGGRYVVPVKAEYRHEIAGLVHDSSASGATVFIEPMSVVEANNEMKVLLSKEEAEIERILMVLSAEAGSFSESIKASYNQAVELNLIFSKARLAYNMKASVPILNDKGEIDLKKARHPLLSVEPVPINIMLGEDFDTLVITGPNTGGKTVALKTLGLLTLMAMCGLMLPVSDNSKVSVFNNVLADIGDEQSIEQSLSTFSSHIKNIISILETADEKTLILLDELGAGTDPVEGAALAMAILEDLRRKGAKIAATTHYAELKAYALDTVGVENGSCEFDVTTLRPTYRLLIGVPGRSNAFAISERLGIKKDVVDRAKELMSMENVRFENVVESLEKSRQRLDKESAEAEKLKTEAGMALKEAETKAAQLKTEYEKEINKARSEAKNIVDRARAESNRLLDELNEIKKQSGDAGELLRRAKAAAKAGLEKAENIADPVTKVSLDNYKLPRPLKQGDSVLITDIDKKGVVLAPPDEGGKVFVQAGIIKTKVEIKNLRLIENEKIKPPKQKAVIGLESRAARSVSVELDLRGKDSLEGVAELEKFIDDAVYNGIGQITVIHGKGTGALRAAVHAALKHNKAVRTFRLGVFGEGENGVTIVELKS